MFQEGNQTPQSWGTSSSNRFVHTTSSNFFTVYMTEVSRSCQNNFSLFVYHVYHLIQQWDFEQYYETIMIKLQRVNTKRRNEVVFYNDCLLRSLSSVRSPHLLHLHSLWWWCIVFVFFTHPNMQYAASLTLCLLACFPMQKTFFQPKFALNAIIVILIMSRWVIVILMSADASSLTSLSADGSLNFKSLSSFIISRWVALLDLDELIIPSKAAWQNQVRSKAAWENQVRTTFWKSLCIRFVFFLFAIHPSSTFTRTISLYVQWFCTLCPSSAKH